MCLAWEKGTTEITFLVECVAQTPNIVLKLCCRLAHSKLEQDLLNIEVF